MSEYSGQVAVVTGAAGGLGAAIAEKCVRQDMSVVASDIRQKELDAEVKRLSKLQKQLFPNSKNEVIGVVCNVASLDSTKNLALETLSQLGRVDMVFANAGVMGTAGWSQYRKFESWKWVMSTNVDSVAHAMHVFVPIMLSQAERGHGNAARICITSSRAAMNPASFATYSVTKHAVTAMGEALHFELETIGKGDAVKVHVLVPGPIKTDLVKASIQTRPDKAAPKQAKDTADFNSYWHDFLQEVGAEPSDLADICFNGFDKGHFYIHPDLEMSRVAWTRRTKGVLDTLVPIRPDLKHPKL